MRCSSYCVAADFDIDSLVAGLNENGLDPKHFNEVIHAQKDVRKDQDPIDIFIFPFGSLVIWGAEESEEQLIIDLVRKYGINIINSASTDFIYFKYDQETQKTFIDEEKNEIILGDKSAFIKLSISYALAQSVKLDVLEKSVSNLLDKTAPIQQELANTGSVSLSKKEISKQIGILFNERYSINLHSDILDTPEFFWRRPTYEPLYLTTAAFQDVQVRQNILHHRLDMIHELYNILSNDLNYKHSTRLEWIIIILITIEVIFAAMHNGVFTKLFELF